VDREIAFSSERQFLLRETVDGNGWLSPLVHGLLAAMCAMWAATFVLAVRHLAPRGGQPQRPATATPRPVPTT
jgi:hypothetical protein